MVLVVLVCISRGQWSRQSSKALIPTHISHITHTHTHSPARDPVFVLVGSLTFIASVFILHIVGKFAAPKA